MDFFIGTILPWPVNFAPEGWALCQGQLIPINQNQALYSLIGNIYGGDNINFALPNLCGRFPVGTGRNQYNETYTLGQKNNSNGQVTLTPANVPIPSHTHNIANTVTASGGGSVPVSMEIKIPVNTEAYAAPPYTNLPTNNTLAAGKQGTIPLNIYTTNPPTADAYLKPFTAQSSINVPQPQVSVTSTCAANAAGTGTPVNVMPPYLCLNYIIALTGIYPTRP